MPIHANYYKWKKDIDIRPYLPLFAGIGIEKLYLFYTRVLNKLGGINFSDGKRLRYPYYYDAFGNRHILYF